ncbi:hypothetical protein J1614_010509 [Plenodomus biglobosus]|nr:hypothetical protein J1614_010509 [Plenodomus biglobosus]
MMPRVGTMTSSHEPITWALTYFAITNEFKSPGGAELFLDRANNEFGLVYPLKHNTVVMAQFPDTDEPIHFAVSRIKAACLRTNTSCRKICVLMAHFQLDLMFATADSAAEFVQLLGRLVTKVGNEYFKIYEATSRSEYFNAVCDGQFSVRQLPNDLQRPTGLLNNSTKETEQRSISLPEDAKTTSTLLQEIYEVYNPTTGSIFTKFALRRALEKEYMMSDILALFMTADKVITPISSKAATALIDRLPFIHDPLNIVDLASSVYHEEFPTMDYGLRKACVMQLQARMPAILVDDDAWEEYAGNKELVKALHSYHCYHCDLLGVGSGTGIMTPPTSPTKK